MPSTQLKNQHLLWRAGFGPSAGQLPGLRQSNPAELYRSLQQAAAAPPQPLDAIDSELKALVMSAQEPGMPRRNLDEAERRMVMVKQRESIRNLNLRWLGEMVHGKAQLREKMAFFWHGHFTARNNNVFFQQQLLEIIRRNALGSFRTLLHETAKSAAILNFLNAQQNRKGHPNENFAREVMELFTLGRGHYSEQDIREAARAFTGWSADRRGVFQFRPFQHDDGVKTLFGKTGKLTGEEVLDLLLEQRATARFITARIFRFFVAEKENREVVDRLAKRFYESDYDISGLMQSIFTSSWFYDPQYIGNRIKSPVELLAGLQRMLPMRLEDEEPMLLLQRLLGQTLFYPPNVAGWPGGRAWIDSSTLMVRLRIPQLIGRSDALNIAPKADDDTMMGRTEAQKEAARNRKNLGPLGKSIGAEVDWVAYEKGFASVPRAQLLSTLAAALFQTAGQPAPAMVNRFVDDTDRSAYIRTATLQLMSTPEYQVC
ncbi:MAG TPA: DUF1800 domain-containing protein [Chitinophagaceae bacterium]|nr:DUF1800 domain-containing protein [Chitinophagaceae bacterium]